MTDLAAALDMSLDDFIKKSNTSRRRGRGGGSRGSRASTGTSTTATTARGGRRRGGISKPLSNATRPAAGSARITKAPRHTPAPTAVASSSTDVTAFAHFKKITVSNLAASVTQSDVSELFRQIGPIQSAALNFDASGKSKGVAVVTFKRAGDAYRAYQEYHNRTLDEKPMRIELLVNPDANVFAAAVAVPAAISVNGRVGGGGAPRGRGGRGGASLRGRGIGRRGGRAPRSAPAESKTADQLDQEMDVYMESGDQAKE